MKHIIRFRWAILVLWIAVMAGTTFFAPNLQTLVAEKGQITVPKGYPSQEANDLIEKMNPGQENVIDGVVVFHNDDTLSSQEQDKIEEAIQLLEENKKTLAISNIIKFTENEETRQFTVSEDETTIIIPFEVSLKNQSVNESRDNIYETLAKIDVDHEVTGGVYLEEDIVINSEDGLTKTIYITVVLILIILFLVFKSLVAPFIPLLTVGMSFLVAQNIVAFLADTVNFPISTFTQIFMVAVMFGIGTDYCILLISRFKEEIANHDTIPDAVIATYRASGKTVFYAALAVLIGFSTIGFSTFSLYQSAVAVAIGVAVTLIALVTIVPFFLVLLGKKLFWPFDKHVEHKESKIWKATGIFAWTRPVIALFIVAAITLPALVFYDGDESYDSLAEISDHFGSVIGFNWIADSFGPGDTLPATVVMEVDHPISSVKDYQAIERITDEITRLDGVANVRSATRPAGEMIDDFLLDTQTELLADGLGEGADGLSEVEAGLREAADELNDSSPQLDEAKGGVSALMDGTKEANDGVGQIQTALSEIEKGIISGSSGAGEIKSGLQQVKNNLDQTIDGNRQLLNGYQQLADGLAQFGITDANTAGLDQLKGALTGARSNIEKTHKIVTADNPLIQQDSDYMTAYHTAIGQIDGSLAGINELEQKLNELANAGDKIQTEVVSPLKELNKNFAQIIAGQEQLSSGVNELIAGIQELETGLGQAATGQGQVVSNLPNLRDGLSQIYGGQDELRAAFNDLQSGLDELSGGLGEGSDGLEQINDGLTTIQKYLGDFSDGSTPQVAIIPEEALENEAFLEAAELYLSDNKKIVKFEVVFSYSPYSQEAIHLIDDINSTVLKAIDDTHFAGTTLMVGGVSSVNNDLKNISDEDYSRTAILMLIGIFIILIFLLKSIIMPIYLIGSLLLTYFTSLAFAELIFVNILGHDGLTWVIPFFSFVMLIALGIDYSIFLMGRFNEFKNGLIQSALLSAMKNMGTVIISATIILGGTFSAMLPSGVLSLLQIATVVIIGLVLYAFVMLPLFTPVMVRFFGKYNWWPFKRQMDDQAEKISVDRKAE